ncbi:MAG: S41 family peptidase [Halanaerobium sp.]|nr:S41 family peptidase [Halanaerobium sp.]
MTLEGTDWRQVGSWIKENKFGAFIALVLLVIDTIMGAFLGAIIAWGPLDANRTIWVGILAVVVGSLTGSLRLWQDISRITGSIQGIRWGKFLNWGRAILIAGIVIMTLFQLYSIGFFPFFPGSYQDNFARLWQAMDNNYPYFASKDVNWDEIYQKYAPRVAEVEDADEYYAIIDRMLCELGDAHTGLLYPRNEDYVWYGMVEEVEGKAVVTHLRPAIDIPGLQDGSVILARNGQSINEYIDQLDPSLTCGSTARQSRYLAFSRVLAAPRGEELVLTYLTPAGEEKEATLRWREEYSASGSTEVEVPLINSRRLSSGVAVIEIPTFAMGTGHDLVEEFDTALDKVMDAPGLIIDLRYNSGGTTLFADPIAGRFITEPFIYGIEYHRQRLPQVGWTRRLKYQVKPRGDTYKGPVVILSGIRNMSTAETFIVSMLDSGRATVIGRTTSGASGNPTTFYLPGGTARFSLGDWRRVDGRRIEGEGIQPEIMVERTIKDIQQDIDRDLLVAENYLLKKITAK